MLWSLKVILKPRKNSEKIKLQILSLVVSVSRQDSHTVCDGKTDTPTPKFVYFEVIKLELNRRLMYECRCDERLNSKVEGSIILFFPLSVCLL
jgi:hypothetical protein